MTDTITIAHLADLHLGYSQYAYKAESGQNQREADVTRAAIACADYVCEVLKPTIAAIAGDMFDKTRVSNYAADDGLAVCQRFERAGIPIVVIPGNHDQSESETAKTVLELARRTGAIVPLDQQTLDLNGVRFHLLPFRAISKALGHGEDVSFDFSRELPNVLVSHAEIEGRGRDVVVARKRWLDDPHFALVLLGHIHHGECARDAGTGNVFYSGAVERLGFDEWHERPGLWLHTIVDGTLAKPSRRISTADAAVQAGFAMTPRPMTQERLEAAELTDFELNDAVDLLFARLADKGELAGGIVKLTVKNVGALFRQSGMEQAWQRRFREAGGFHLEVDAQTERMATMLDPQIAPVGDASSGFLGYVGKQTFADDEERERRMSIAADVMLAAREKLAAAEEVD